MQHKCTTKPPTFHFPRSIYSGQKVLLVREKLFLNKMDGMLFITLLSCKILTKFGTQFDYLPLLDYIVKIPKTKHF